MNSRLGITLLCALPCSLFGKHDAVVAADGSGDHETIQAAIMAAPYRVSSPPWIIHVKPGIYKERLYVQNETVGRRIHRGLKPSPGRPKTMLST